MGNGTLVSRTGIGVAGLLLEGALEADSRFTGLNDPLRLSFCCCARTFPGELEVAAGDFGGVLKLLKPRGFKFPPSTIGPSNPFFDMLLTIGFGGEASFSILVDAES